MRYRVKDYTVDVYQGNVRVFLTVPNTLIEAYPSVTEAEKRKITEAIRLINDETAGVVFCSSMQKNKIVGINAQNDLVSRTEIIIKFAIPDGKTIASTDQFTIEMDWGDTIKDHIPTDYAKQGTNPNATISAILEALQGSGTPSPDIPEGVAERLVMILEHFGIKTISGYEFMSDTEVTDELEDIMQALDPELLQQVEYPEGSGTYMTKAQAITAEAMQIINPSQS